MAKRLTLTAVAWLAMVLGVGGIVVTLGTYVQHTIVAKRGRRTYGYVRRPRRSPDEART
ncbi:MAG TPA: hypothetical protein VGP31_16865 [Planosporangium sp.]|jgi:hypothetical protein|nr:hypothetical protein [Planosporangium sp.]